MKDIPREVHDRIARDMGEVEASVRKGSFARAKEPGPTDGEGVQSGGENVPSICANQLPLTKGGAKGTVHAGGATEEKAAAKPAQKGPKIGPQCKPGFCAPRKDAGAEARISDLTDPQAEVLLGVHEGCQNAGLATQAVISKKTGKSVSRVCRAIRELEGMGFVHKIPRSSPMAYKLTVKGDNAVIAVEAKLGVLRGTKVPGGTPQSEPGGDEDNVGEVRAHNFQVKIPMTRSPLDEDLVKTGWQVETMNGNWRKYHGKRLAGISCHVHPKSVMVWLPEFYAPSPQAAAEKAMAMLKAVVTEFQTLYPKAVLGSPEVVNATTRVDMDLLQQHIALVDDEFAKWAIGEKLNIREERFEVDASAGKPELEFVHKKDAMVDGQKYVHLIKDVLSGRLDLKLAAGQKALEVALLNTIGGEQVRKITDEILAAQSRAAKLNEQTAEAMNLMVKMAATDRLDDRLKAQQELDAALRPGARPASEPGHEFV